VPNVYFGDGFVHATDGNWNNVANWYSALGKCCCCTGEPGTPLGRLPMAGDSVFIAQAGTTPPGITTGPIGGWAGPLTIASIQQNAQFPPYCGYGNVIHTGSYSGTVTINCHAGNLDFGYSGISGGTFSGTVILDGQTVPADPESDETYQACAITGGTFTGTVTRKVAAGTAGDQVIMNMITGGTYSPTASCALKTGNVLDDTHLPVDPGFAEGGGSFTPIINVTGVPSGSTANIVIRSGINPGTVSI
jgi:hypothetical protein